MALEHDREDLEREDRSRTTQAAFAWLREKVSRRGLLSAGLAAAGGTAV